MNITTLKQILPKYYFFSLLFFTGIFTQAQQHNSGYVEGEIILSIETSGTEKISLSKLETKEESIELINPPVNFQEMKIGSNAKLIRKERPIELINPSINIEEMEIDQNAKLQIDQNVPQLKGIFGNSNLAIYTGSGSINSYTYSGNNVLEVKVSVVNNGSAPSGSFRVGFYLSTNTTVTTLDYLVQTFTRTNLDNGFYTNISISVDLDEVSNLPAGDYYVGILLDDNSDVSEISEADNSYCYYTETINYTPPPMPNLTMYYGSGSDNTALLVTPSNVLDVNVSIDNDGNAATGNFSVGFYLSANTTISSSDHLC